KSLRHSNLGSSNCSMEPNSSASNCRVLGPSSPGPGGSSRSACSSGTAHNLHPGAASLDRGGRAAAYLRRLSRVIHRAGTEIVNWYLLEDGGRVTIVDAGCPSYRSQLDSALAAIGRRLEDVEAIVLTHA